MDCVIRATPASISVTTIDARVRVNRVRFTAMFNALTVALIARPVSIGNSSISAVPADNTLHRREMSHV